MVKKINRTALERIIKDMTDVVEKSKDEIFYISEEAFNEHAYLQSELVELKLKVINIINRGDELEIEVKNSKNLLATVSQQFDRYSENDIKHIYERTHKLQTELIMVGQEEKVLRSKRDDIERRLIRLNKTVEYADEVGRKVAVVLTYLHDDFSQVNEALDNAQQKQQLGLKIIEAQENERKKLSREIHDGPAQTLAHILMQSEIVDLSFREGNVDLALEEVKAIRTNIRASLHEVRRIIYDLRPMALDDLGLFPTVKKYATTAIGDKLNLDLNFTGDDKDVEPTYEIAIFRLVQEALQNILKHAFAENIILHIKIKEKQINILIEDDGVGFDFMHDKEQSFGIIGMRERVDLLDGSISINSLVGQGTKITVVLPY